MSRVELRLEQIVWLESLQVDKKTADKAQASQPMPTELTIPDYIRDGLAKIEEITKKKKQQERAEIAAAVLNHSEEMKRNLLAPRVSAPAELIELEDVT